MTAKITNAGNVAGAEVAQLYMSYPAAANEPPQVLRGFQKINLPPTESGTVSFKLTPKEFSVYDPEEASGGQPFKVFEGSYTAIVSASSRDARLRATIDYKVAGSN